MRMPNDEAQRGEDLRYISDPSEWPVPLCPLKRDDPKTKRREVGYLVADEGPRVRTANMFAAKPDDPVIEYANFAAIVDAGWRVD